MTHLDNRIASVPLIAREVPRTVKFHAPEIVFGVDALGEAAHAAARLGAVRPMLVTDLGLIEAGWVTELTEYLRSAGLRPEVFSAVTPNPKDHEVAAGFERYAAAGCDVIIGIGGGSVMDAAKGVAILATNGGHILDYVGVDRVSRPVPPMVMVPTTSGTGADVSQFCIVTDTARATKVTILGRTLVPDVTVIDPRLLTTMPEWLGAASGLDALTHGVEAYVSLAHNPLTDHHALRAVGMVTDALAESMAHPKRISDRLVMAQASLEAGMAFTNAILGAAHAMSHQVGGLLDKPHGVINGILLPHVIRFNAETDPRPYVAIAAGMGLPEQFAPPAEAAAAVADRVQALAREVGTPRGLADLGVPQEVLPRLAAQSLRDSCMTTNPRPATVDEMTVLFRAAM
ncbi:iron-containing alcohol dehydrogenase [Tsukamurella sp. PLM1]|uniref:iron-containing alcohol dehydrogenase n=1 Tax=Tsukamurella sp. PLM1 TaxID=2929795 RepID=UPI00204B5474|nr:1,3-propanediol dehydrogenase [Tsukamurella sp. PLM1]